VVVSEEVLNLVQGHVVGVGRGTEGSPNKIAGAISRDDSLQLWEVLWVQFVVFDEVGGGLSVSVRGEHADYLLLQERLVVDHQFGGGDPLRVDQVENQLQNVKFIEESELGYYDRSFSEFGVLQILLSQLKKVVRVHNPIHFHGLHKVKDDLGSEVAQLVLSVALHLFSEGHFVIDDHIAQRVDHDADHQLWYFLLDATRF